MAITYGLTSDGFVAKPLPVVQQEIDTGLKAILGESAGTEPDGSIPLRSVAGQIKTFFSDGIAAMWDLLQLVYSSFDPASTTGASEDAVCSITGTLRRPASFSAVVETCVGTPGTILPIARVVTVAVTNSRFLSTEAATIAALTAWQASHGYVVGDQRTNASRCYVCITAGTSAGSGGPTTTAADITDGTVHWKYLGEGTGTVAVHYQAESTGPVGADAGSLATIATPVSGWRNAVNLLDATLGTDLESDSALRIRRANELAASGNAAADAIRTNVLNVNQGSTDPDHLPVTACRVFYNDTNVTDTDGLPPHSVEVLVLGAPDADVAAAVFASVGAGITMYGSTSAVVVDSAGNNQTVHFTRPTPIDIYIVADVTYDPKTFPTDLSSGATSIKEALALYGDAYQIGTSVRATALSAQVFDGPSTLGGQPVPGVLDVTDLFIGTAPAPVTSTTVAIGVRELAAFDTSRITVNLTPGTP